MEVAVAVEVRRPVRETPAQRLFRVVGAFFAGLARLACLAALVLPILLAGFLTADLPFRGLDHLFLAPALKPSLWLTYGGLVMSAAPLIIILIARRFGGEEAGRVVTAAWAVAAGLVFAEISYLAPTLEEGDFPSVRFVAAFVASAMLGQYVAAAAYDLLRGGGSWWRAPFYAAFGGLAAQSVVFFVIAYWTASAPWINWMISDVILKAAIAVVFLGVYALLRKSLRPVRGYGGR